MDVGFFVQGILRGCPLHKKPTIACLPTSLSQLLFSLPALLSAAYSTLPYTTPFRVDCRGDTHMKDSEQMAAAGHCETPHQPSAAYAYSYLSQHKISPWKKPKIRDLDEMVEG